MIRVLLADDQQLIREALAALLGLEVDLQIVGQVGSGDEVLGAVALLKPDVVLLDVQMPGTLLTDGIEAAAATRGPGAAVRGAVAIRPPARMTPPVSSRERRGTTRSRPRRFAASPMAAKRPRAPVDLSD